MAASMVFDCAHDAPIDAITAWLRTSPRGRCAYRCDNDVQFKMAESFERNETAMFILANEASIRLDVPA